MKAIAFIATMAMPPADTVPLTTSVPDSKRKQAEHIIDDRCTDDRFGRFCLEFPQLFQHIGGDCDTRCCQCGPDEDSAGHIEPEEQRKPVPANPWDDNPDPGDYPVPRREDIFQVKFKPDHKEQDNSPEVGKAADKISIGNQPQKTRPDKKSDKDQSDNGRLVDT